MVISKVTDLGIREEQAIIINVGTRLSTTLALLSTLRFAGMPVLVVDCPLVPEDTSEFRYFCELMNSYDFDLISLPLNEHGITLDYLFKHLSANYILLVDSDLEIYNGELIPLMKKYIRNKTVFGAGFTHGPCWLKPESWEMRREGYYPERFWVPFTLLDVKIFKEALLENRSFKTKIFYNLIPRYQKLSRQLLTRVPFLKVQNYSFLNFMKRDFHGRKLCFSYYDTGADLFQYLKFEKGYSFVGIGIESSIQLDYVVHYEGVTRKLMDASDKFNSVQISDIEIQILDRLKQAYGFNYNSLSQWDTRH